jgi:hypothetical protein
MPLSQADRIQFSKSIVSANQTVSILQSSLTSLQAQIVSAQAKDTANAGLTSSITPFINSYQSELQNANGVAYTTFTETDIQNAGNLLSGNFFYPNSGVVVPTFIPTGYWTNMVPYARGNARGASSFSGTYASPAGNYETAQLTTAINAITAIKAKYLNVERSTQQRASQSGTCSINNVGAPPGGVVTNTVCTTGGGTWTAGADSVYTVADIGTLGTAVINAISALLTTLNNYTYLTTPAQEPNATRRAANIAARASRDALVSAITTWQAYTNFVASGVTSATVFYNTYSPPVSKFRNTEIDALNTALTTRQTAVNSRITALTSTTYLGTLDQNASGSTSVGGTTAGLYLTRYNYLSLRLSLAGGSLFALNGLNKGVVAQNQLIANAQNEAATYSTLLTCSALSAPSNGTNFVSLNSATGFSVGNNVFIASDDQPEIARAIKSISGNRIELGQPVPQGYATNQNARLYKDLT